MNGNGNLCRAIVRAGAPLGIGNKQGLSIFNTPVASKQLLFKLLGKYNLNMMTLCFYNIHSGKNDYF